MAESLIDHVDVASWLLGALTPDEASEFTAHLEGCEQCQTEIRELGPVARLLLDNPDDADVEPPADLEHRTLLAITSGMRRRRARRWGIGGTVGTLLLIAATTVTLALVQPIIPAGADYSAKLSATAALRSMAGYPGDRTAFAAVGTQHASGWSADVALGWLPASKPGEYYECWYGDGHGGLLSGGSFVAMKSGAQTMQMWTAVKGDEDAVMEITLQRVGDNGGVGTVLLSGPVTPGSGNA